MTVTHTLVSGPRVVLTSRPAKTLSDGASIRIVRVLGRLRRGRKLAVMIIARRDKITGRASGVVRVGSKLVRHVRSGVSRGTSPFNGGKFVGWGADRSEVGAEGLQGRRTRWITRPTSQLFHDVKRLRTSYVAKDQGQSRPYL